MPQKYVVYLNEKSIFFNNLRGNLSTPPGVICWSGREENTIYEALNHVNNSSNNSESVFLTDFNLDEGLHILGKHLKILEAAGGIVKNPLNEFLLIHRLGKWDLPKGKMEKNEKPEITAEREIIEETGIHPGAARSFIAHTYHIYVHQQKTILKKTWWYSFLSDHIQLPVPQTEEDIQQAVWKSREETAQAMALSYPSIRDVWELYLINDC
jgi:8-oxo-dGTP pyrophosphatase MutT (NUDIX family)